MRLVVQRVKSSSVSTAERGIIGSIGYGLSVLVGIGQGDGTEEVEWAVKNLLEIRFWPSSTDNKPWKRNIRETGYEILLVSQFTLYSKVYKRGRLDFHNALAPDPARNIFDQLYQRLSAEIGTERAKQGEFGSYMEVFN